MARSFAEARELLIGRARSRRNPFTHADPDRAVRVLRELSSADHDEWVGAFAVPARAAADDREAYGWWRVARYPAPTSEVKRDAYVRSQEHYLAWARTFAPALEAVAIPFAGRPGEGKFIGAHLRRPPLERPPVLVVWGGIDAFKEERRADAFLAAGIATLAVDMPGTGDAPLAGSPDAERMWDAVLDWIGQRPDLDPQRVAILGSSTGGYWAAKLARTHRHRIRAAVDHGGPVHHAFSAEWIERAETGEYPFGLSETLAAAFGGAARNDWVRIAPSLSLRDQGVLDRPSAPLLVVHGRQDTVFPVADAELLVAHGAEALIVPGGHMGAGGVTSRVLDWIRGRLA